LPPNRWRNVLGPTKIPGRKTCVGKERQGFGEIWSMKAREREWGWIEALRPMVTADFYAEEGELEGENSSN